jgi:probable F420-dependent oxidoreductase
MDLGAVGIWTHYLDMLGADQATEAVAELESLGYGSVWIPETVTRDPLIAATLFLAGTQSIVLGTGIANIWGRDAQAMASGHRTISEAFPGRFILGLGVSHQVLVESVRGHAYERPLSAMRDYLAAMDRAVLLSPAPAEDPVRVLAALRPKMLELSASAAQGAHPYNMDPGHTERARELIGPDALLIPEQAVVLDPDPTTARAAGRDHLSRYLGLPNYENGWRTIGFDDADFADGGSDRLVDAVVAWGDEDAVVARVQAHLDAGADHVAVQVIMPSIVGDPRPVWRALAGALTSL